MVEVYCVGTNGGGLLCVEEWWRFIVRGGMVEVYCEGRNGGGLL